MKSIEQQLLNGRGRRGCEGNSEDHIVDRNELGGGDVLLVE